jgi:DNA-binding IclR family transcriptional regulator
MPTRSRSQASKRNTRTEAEAQEAGSAIGKAFAVLQALRSASVPQTLTAVAERVGVAPSSAHTMLAQLLAQDAVVQDQDKRYSLGPSTFYIGSAYARGSRIYRAIWVELVSAANELGVTTALAVPWNDRHLVLNDHRAGTSTVALPLGGRVPLAASSWGKVYFGWSGAKLDGKLDAYTAASITDKPAFMAEVEEARRLGYAVDRGEFFDGVGGVAAPLTSDAGYEGLASFIGPLGLIEEIGFDRLGRKLAQLAERASLALGDRERVKYFGTE